ncbi:MAG TPA: NAD-dependent epimerase/dehydratase family protein [Pseudomonadales bacterium]
MTGGGGFIGARLVRALSAAGAQVRTLLGPQGSDVVMPPAGVPWYRGEVDDPAALTQVLRDAETVVHLAGPPSVAQSFRSPRSYARIHVGGTAAVVEACTRLTVRRLVYVSSAEVYGTPRQNPVTEDAPCEPRSPYAAAKVGGEAFVRAGAMAAGFEVVICRPFLVYGPGMAPTSLVSSLINQAERSNAIEVQDPRPIRDYCFVDDVVAALVRSCRIALPESIRVYNLGSGTGMAVGELAERILSLRWGGGSVRAAAHRDRPGRADILELVADTSRAARELGWRAEIGIEHGLTEMLRSSAHGE